MDIHNGQLEVWTVGHSTRPIDELLDILKSFKIATLVDVRSYPGSRRYPQFNKANLAASLEAAGIEYVHQPQLGGRRPARKDSTNIAWRNESFRGYADYMETESFREAIEDLLGLAREQRTAVMCAEAVWWRCHRALISDYLKARGITVIHILAADKSEPHPYTSAARIVNGELSYKALLAS
ncbi:MAG TPA: DUF488 domain-containing protein [Pyrinomonadaceae bacterium]|jgi:uncharacterized protein (DUF488 family)